MALFGYGAAAREPKIKVYPFRQFLGLLRRPFARHVAMVAAGTAVAQALTIAFYPIITRIYGPEAFGTLGVFLSVVALLTPIAGLAYPLAIVLPKSDADAVGLVRLSLLAGAAVALTLGLSLLISGGSIGELLHAEQIPGLVVILPVAVIALTVQQVAQQWLTRTKHFALISKITVFQSLLVNVSKAGFGLILPHAVTLTVVAVAGLASHAVALWLGGWRRMRRPEKLEDTPLPQSLLELARRYQEFPIYRAPQDFLNAVSQGLPILVLATLYGPAIAGLFVLARSILGAPLELVGNSIGTVLYPRLAEAANRGEKLWRLVAVPTGLLAALGAIPFFMVFAFGPTLFEFLFGPEWREGGEYARWMALWVMFMFANIPSVRIIPVIRIQHIHLLFTVLVVAVRAAAIATGYVAFNSALHSVVLYSVSGAALNAVLILYVLHRVRGIDLRQSLAAVP